MLRLCLKALPMLQLHDGVKAIRTQWHSYLEFRMLIFSWALDTGYASGLLL